LHLIYPISTTGNRAGQLVYRRSLDAGHTWEPGRILFESGPRLTEAYANLSIAARAGMVVVAFRSHDARQALLFTRTSLDSGDSWGPRVRIASDVSDLRMGISAVAISDAGIVIAWSIRRTGRIYARLSTDHGVSFEAPRWLATTHFDFACGNGEFRDGMVGLAAEGKSVDLAWINGYDGPCGPNQLYLRRSTDGGKTWRARQVLPTGDTLGWPEIAVQGKNVLLLIPPRTGAGQLLLRSSDGGRNFTATVLDAARPTGQGDVVFAADGEAMVALPENTLSNNGFQVLSSRLVIFSSLDDGATWSRQLVQSHAGPVGQPNVAIAGGQPTIVYLLVTSDTVADIVATTRADRTLP
jgi:hypothetical protein